MHERELKPEGIPRVVKLLAGGALQLASPPVGLATAVVAFFGAAYVSSSVAGLALAGVLALIVVTGGLSALGAKLLTNRPGRLRRWLPAGVTAVTLALTGLGANALVFQPMDVEYVAMEPTEDTRYWELPTGSRIAYWHTPARPPEEPAPIVFLHGGPGAPGAGALGHVAAVLSAEGFHVYHYHQVGAGLSARLEDVAEYTVERHVADLEAIRRAIGAERMHLVGGSWGGTLAAHYMAAYPDRVERAVFASPGAIWRTASIAGARDPVPESPGPEVDVVTEAATPRFGVVYGLTQINPRAAVNLASDEEMSGFMQPLIGQIIAGDVTLRDEDGEPTRMLSAVIPRGYGFYAMMVTSASLSRTRDPRDRLRELDAPVLILRGEYDRIRLDVHREYEKVFRNATFVILEGAAHSVSESPSYPEMLRAFFTGHPLPVDPAADL